MAKQALCKKAIDTEAGIVSFTFTNGRVLSIIPGDLPVDMFTRLALHGVAQKVGDSYAGATTPDEAYANAEAVIEALYAGQWNAGRESTGGILVEAIARLTGKPIAECKAAFDALPEASQKAIAADVKVAAMVATIRLERAKAKAEKTDTGIDLGGLFQAE